MRNISFAEAYNTFEPVLECPLCGGSEFREHSKKILKYLKCKCNMVFQSSYMPDTGWYYKDYYRLCVPPFEDEVTDERIKGETKSGLRYKRHVNLAPRRHLDIGSSTGSFLRVMRDAYGCEAVGVEPGDKFRKYSNEHGIKAVANISEVEGKFDFISMCQVLEHIIKPMEHLAIVRGLLEDDGYLLIEVPYMMPAFSHPLLFNEDTLEKMITRAGFVISHYGITKKVFWVKVVKDNDEDF